MRSWLRALVARLWTAAAWHLLGRPRYRAGQIVRNRYSGKVETRDVYMQPHHGVTELGKACVTEAWLTTAGNLVAVGYFWLLLEE